MVQTESMTNEGFIEAAKLLQGTAASVVKSVVCIKTSCTASTAQTEAGITKCDESGLTLADADSVTLETGNVAGDTVRLAHEFTAGAAATVKGFGVLNDDDDVLYALCCFAADIPMESGDILNVQMDITLEAS